MFKQIRVQILYPCQARCAWCSTHRKNPLFEQLYRDGVSERVHQFYIATIQRLRPKEVFVSGGEPLLYPEIAAFLNAIADSTEHIEVFTSYQYSAETRGGIHFDQVPLSKITLNHTLIGFEPQQWHALTAGFPFDVYAENIRALMRVPVRKRFKFIVNHAQVGEEMSRFKELAHPDENCELGFKVVNDQGKHQNAPAIRKTRGVVRERVRSLGQLAKKAGWSKANHTAGSLGIMSPVLESGDVGNCLYRRKPIELRFALYRADHRTQVLKYRYCPYFPSHFGYRFHIGRDDPQKLEWNYFTGDFREHCTECRFLAYQTEDQA
ncbi:MAG: hypothetical protein A2Y73_03940 [Chloroflexi bacterium RBG_13_56_8]|nr:MAG: hypothetical protein A2Y73_03940 [Chloroflexi bacterium RBG_13_56_8]